MVLASGFSSRPLPQKSPYSVYYKVTISPLNKINYQGFFPDSHMQSLGLNFKF
jgi:hypothetical protein